MPHAELVSWREFFVLYPFDDFHRFHRPAALAAASHPEIRSPNDAFNGKLKVLSPTNVETGFSDADMSVIKAFGGTPPPTFKVN